VVIGIPAMVATGGSRVSVGRRAVGRWSMVYTLVTTGRPNRPLGFTQSTATMMQSAIESFISRPTTGM
jgi:hypothetical protein